MKGLHLTADLYRCRCDDGWLADARQLHAWCAAAAEAVGLRPVGHAFQAFAPAPAGGGLSGTLLMEGSHLCLHTWPGEKAVSADVYVSGADSAAKARGLMFALVQRFQPEWTEQRSLDRGEEE
jgi:S-adenosylmethionine decarboxylase